VSLVFLHMGNGDFEREVRMSEAFHPVLFQEVLQALFDSEGDVGRFRRSTLIPFRA
jgi:hypothetical protein